MSRKFLNYILLEPSLTFKDVYTFVGHHITKPFTVCQTVFNKNELAANGVRFKVKRMETQTNKRRMST